MNFPQVEKIERHKVCAETFVWAGKTWLILDTFPKSGIAVATKLCLKSIGHQKQLKVPYYVLQRYPTMCVWANLIFLPQVWKIGRNKHYTFLLIFDEEISFKSICSEQPIWRLESPFYEGRKKLVAQRLVPRHSFKQTKFEHFQNFVLYLELLLIGKCIQNIHHPKWLVVPHFV